MLLNQNMLGEFEVANTDKKNVISLTMFKGQKLFLILFPTPYKIQNACYL